jgi:hypothetical protein
MALVSPGVEVNIIDQSQYLPAATNSVPLLILASAQNKANAAGTAVAQGTLKANANKLYQVTSQRDLTTLFGNPFFYKTTNGTPIHGYELNEYGLLAAYSLLGTTNRCYILRADIDLSEFVGSVSRPSGEAMDGTYWLDTTNSTWGIYEFNATSGKFVNQIPYVLTSSDQLTGSRYPLDNIGNIGEYAVVSKYNAGPTFGDSTYFYKTTDNTWVPLGSDEWTIDIPAVTSTISNPSLTTGNSFDIIHELTSISDVTMTATYNIGVSAGNTIDNIATKINALGLKSIYATVTNNKLNLFFSLGKYTLSNHSTDGSLLTQLGITAGDYFAPVTQYGTSAQMPLWTSSQSKPRPTGSVWIKTSSAGNGLSLSLSKYNVATASWASQSVATYSNEINATAAIDSTGGKAIPINTVFAKYTNPISTGFGACEPIKLFNRIATGATVTTTTVANPTITTGNYITVYVSIPGEKVSSTDLPATKIVFQNTGTTAASFVTDWQNAQIPYTTATLNTDGTIQITHTMGGEIFISDINPNTYVSSGILADIGLDGMGTKYGPLYWIYATGLTPTAVTTSGTGGSISVIISNPKQYVVEQVSGGSGYAVGDIIKIQGQNLGGVNGTNDLRMVVSSVIAGALASVEIKSDSQHAAVHYYTQISNWEEIDYTANEGAPVELPANGRHWFYSSPTQVDIMINKGGVWKGYRNTNYDSSGHPSSTGTNSTDVAGVIVSASTPTTQSTGTALVYGDLWLDSADLENYPMLYRWQAVSGVDQWVLVDKTDQTSSSGILFADARWSSSGAINPVDDPIPTIASLLTSNHLDLDAPDAALSPQGMLLFNTRRSGYNVKEFKTNYFTNKNYPNAGNYNSAAPTNNANLPQMNYAWVSASGLKSDGSAYLGRHAQRHMIVSAMKAAIDTNQTIREEDNFFNLIAAPGYPELQPNMVTLNNDRNNTAYIVGDTPLRLNDQATAITNWANNTGLATESGEDGWVTRDTYMGVFYPSGITSDTTGTAAVVPASHMMLRTLLRNDTIGYPWLAPAGTRRGTIDNATNIGYLDATTGEFQVVKNRMSIRDVLYTNQINPLAFFTGIGLLNYGNKNSFDSQSALDRINVSRLVCYIRERLQVAARPFVFEPNDALTRNQLTGVVQSLFIDLVAKRGLYDYLVVCDTSNNTPARIDRNELWIDIAIEPVKAAEFIYIPVRVMNTGAIGAQ